MHVILSRGGIWGHPLRYLKSNPKPKFPTVKIMQDRKKPYSTSSEVLNVQKLKYFPLILMMVKDRGKGKQQGREGGCIQEGL